MEIDERIKALLPGCVWVQDVSTALRLVPSLALDMPPITALPGDNLCLPIACGEAVLTGVAEVIFTIAEPALRGAREPIHEAKQEALLADPLVPLLAQLCADAAQPGLSMQATPALVVAWATARLLSGDRSWRGNRNRELRELRQHMLGLPLEQRGQVLASIGWSISGRIAAAGALARRSGWNARVGGLARAVLTSPLTLAFASGSIGTGAELSAAARVLGVALDEELLTHLQLATRAAIAAADARRQAGTGTPADAELAALIDQEEGSLLFRAGIGPRLVAMFPELVSASALSVAGVPPDTARELVQPAVAQALASSWGALLHSLLRWDVLSALCALIAPVQEVGGQWRVEQGLLPANRPWSLLAPQVGRRPAPKTAVAFRLTHLRQEVRQAAVARKMLVLSGLVEREWARWAEDAPAAALLADHGVVLFDDPLEALRFAVQTRAALRKLKSINIGALGEPLRLAGAVHVPVGIATGEAQGAFDGERVRLQGAAIADAIALTGTAIDEAATPDPLGIRSAGFGVGGLHNSGIVATAAAAQAMLQRARARKLPVYSQKEGGTAGGISSDFVLYPMQAWWEGDGGLYALLGLQDRTAGVVEVLPMEGSALMELHQSDAMLGRAQSSRPAPAASRSAPPSDPFGSPPAADEPAERDPFFSDAADDMEPAAAPEGAPADFFADGDPFAALGQLDELDPFASADSPDAATADDPFAGEDDPTEDPDSPAAQGSGADVVGDFFATLDDIDEPSAARSDAEDDTDADEELGFALEADADEELGFALEADADEELGFALEIDADEELGFALGAEADEALRTSAEPESAAGEGRGPSLEDELTAAAFTLDLDDVLDGMVPPEEPTFAMGPDEDEEEPFSLEIDEDEEDQDAFISEWDDEVATVMGFAPGAPSEPSPMLMEPSVPSPPMMVDDEPFDDDEATIIAAPPMLLDDDDLDGGGFEIAPAADGAHGRKSQVSEEFLATDIARIFQRYVVITPEQGRRTFGLPDDQSLRDVHSYSCGTDPDAAYRQFLLDKLREGFMPQIHMTEPLGVHAHGPLDMACLERAYQAMMGGGS